MVWWRITNRPAAVVMPLLPWWVAIETIGRVSGKRRRTALARGPGEPGGLWLVAVHGRHAGWVKNLTNTPQVRVRLGLRWRAATASIHPISDELLSRCNAYTRSGPRLVGLDPVAVRVEW